MNGSPLPALPAVYSFLFPEVGDVIRRFDAVSSVVGLLVTTVVLKNSRTPIRTDTSRKREVDRSTHAVESNR